MRRASFENVAALVGLHAERGEIEAAERRYAESCNRYRGVSPFPLALLDFQLGLMWMNESRLVDARRSFEAALRRVPAYAPAQGHLAEVEAELGETDSAIVRLYRLAMSSDDPDYAAQLARILGETGQDGESRHWCQLAAARFEELVASRPEAFADHAAEFWLGAGADPRQGAPVGRNECGSSQHAARPRAPGAGRCRKRCWSTSCGSALAMEYNHDRGSPSVRSGADREAG